MPIFMDRHDVSETVTAEHVAQLHQEDLKVQDRFNCRGLTYWFDEKRKTAFCLVEAPTMQSIQQMHDQAHGQVPHHIIQVEANVVESFLGRIEDPEETGNSDLPIINDPAFRAIMVTGFSDSSCDIGLLNSTEFNLTTCMKSLAGVFNRFNGRIVKQERNCFLVSFQSVSDAVWCAIEVHTKFEDWSEAVHCKKINLKTGICEGQPVTASKSFFEDAVQSAEKLFYISNSKIVVSHEIKKLYMNENVDVYLDRELFVPLSPSDEKFLNHLMNYMAETWQNPNLQVDDLGKHLGYSKSQLYRKMISVMEMSPNNFIKDYRLDKALNLINEQTGNIAEVAYETGFNSPSYFAKCFHKKYGVLPSEYLLSIAG